MAADKGFAEAVANRLRRHKLMGDDRVIDITRLSDIYRREGKFTMPQGDEFAAEVARQLVDMGRMLVANTQTFYDGHYKVTWPQSEARIEALGVSISALANAHFGRGMPERVIIPMAKEADHGGKVQKILDRCRTLPSSSGFRITLQQAPYAADGQVTAIGPIDAKREKRTAFIYRLTSLG